LEKNTRPRDSAQQRSAIQIENLRFDPISLRQTNRNERLRKSAPGQQIRFAKNLETGGRSDQFIQCSRDRQMGVMLLHRATD
jgi:hypothetical protein